jgi:hypothetical protein
MYFSLHYSRGLAVLNPYKVYVIRFTYHHRYGRAKQKNGYERVLAAEINHEIGKEKMQRLERTNGILRQETGRWHRRQNKFAKAGEQTKVTARLVVSYFNWIWENIRLGTTAAQRAGLTDERWTWNNLALYPTLL